jgi:hypothetical protein
LKQRNESPWGSYDESHELDRGGPVTVTVAVQREPGIALVNIQKFTKPEMEAALYRYQTVRHSSFVAALEAFITDDHLYVVLEDMPISLEHIVKLPRYPTEVQLVAILTPVKLPSSLNAPKSSTPTTLSLLLCLILVERSLISITACQIQLRLTAAVILHPSRKWRWVERHWNQEWIVPAKAMTRDFWEDKYKSVTSSNTPPASSSKPQNECPQWLKDDNDSELQAEYLIYCAEPQVPGVN